MSTEHQQYSPQNQADAIQEYADLHGIELVRTYADHGRSGPKVAGRKGLQRLFADVTAGQADFSILLVYDVSRWGRFQDADESAHHEYALKEAGISVHYCAEQFANDGSIPSALFKTIKRTMAAEYSRELSNKVFAGQSRLVELGFRIYGIATFGFQTQLLDKDGRPKAILAPEERKSIQSDRVILVPGREDDIAVVTSIYRSFIELGQGESRIAALLNNRGVKTQFNRPWSRDTIHKVLTNPNYIGTNVYNRRSYKLQQRKVRNPSELWIKCDKAFEPIVSVDKFKKAQEIIRNRLKIWNDESLLARLRGCQRWPKQPVTRSRTMAVLLTKRSEPGSTYI